MRKNYCPLVRAIQILGIDIYMRAAILNDEAHEAV
jgi:hypothetical protein